MTYSLIILLNLLQKSYATDAPMYPVPEVIRTAELSQIADVNPILDSSQVQQYISQFATALNAKEIEQQNLFNQVALLSLRNEVNQINQLANGQYDIYAYLHYQLYHQAMALLSAHQQPTDNFDKALTDLLSQKFSSVDDKVFVQMVMALGWSVANARDYAFNLFKQVKNEEKINQNNMVTVAVNTHLFHVLDAVIPVTTKWIEQEQKRRFIIEPNHVVKLKNGVELSTTIVRSRQQKKSQSTALQFTIYADESAHIKTAMNAAAHGYIGVVANARGKRSSPQTIVPWEHDGEDAALVIDWITEQIWSDGNVVMYGGSYNGFTQWAAAKHMPKGLKAIAPYVAANLITGLPYENNIALTGNFEWALYVTNNNTVDNSIYNDWQRTNNILDELYTSGRPIVDIDKIANKPSPWLQKWLAHPEDSTYYQQMVPHAEDYKRIDIPVLTITGYFEGGQISALHYLHEHYKYNPKANHSLLIGPYNHWSAQNTPRSHHSNYALDPVALEKNTETIVFSWFDHVLRGKEAPKLVQDKVNYQVMGTNQWRFADSLQVLNQQALAYYIESPKVNTDSNYLLATKPSKQSDRYIEQVVDLSDRTQQRNAAPWPVIQQTLDKQNGIQIETPVFTQNMELTGAISGYFDIEIDKKDVDIGFNYYEVTQAGEVFHLNNYRSRASYADDMSQRRLLTPNEKRRVPIVNARFTSKLIKKGSKIVLVLNVNQNVDAQVNLGTGKDVNHEHVSEAGEPLKLKWYLSSQINLPLKPWKN